MRQQSVDSGNKTCHKWCGHVVGSSFDAMLSG